MLTPFNTHQRVVYLVATIRKTSECAYTGKTHTEIKGKNQFDYLLNIRGSLFFHFGVPLWSSIMRFDGNKDKLMSSKDLEAWPLRVNMALKFGNIK